MGNGIAQSFAASGAPVVLIDIEQNFVDRVAWRTIDKSLDRFVKKEKITAEQKAEIQSRISATHVVRRDGRRRSSWSRPSRKMSAVKQKVFAEADRLTSSEAILASNTSSISITVLGAATGRSGQVIGMHFMNPVPLMKLVEVIRGQGHHGRGHRECCRMGHCARQGAGGGPGLPRVHQQSRPDADDQ